MMGQCVGWGVAWSGWLDGIVQLRSVAQSMPMDDNVALQLAF
jgi:hypothetical protein